VSADAGLTRYLLIFTNGVGRALDELAVPIYVIDRDGTFRWMSKSAIRLMGNAVGQKFTTVIAPEHVHLARRQFAKKLIGAADRTDFRLAVRCPERGRVTVSVTSAPLRDDGAIVGVLGMAVQDYQSTTVGRRAEGALRPDALTPRQHEVLRLLARGMGTREIAAALGVAEETTRNHVRGLLRNLNVHSRLEAVAVGYEQGLLGTGPAGGD